MILQFVANGLVAGAVYAFSAMGFALIYGTTRIFHFAHGAVYALAAYGFFLTARIWGLHEGLSVIISLMIAAIFGSCTESFVYYPLLNRKAAAGTYLVSSLGIYIFVVNLIAIAVGSDTKIITQGMDRTFNLGPMVLASSQVLALATFLIVFPVFFVFMRKTKLGKAIRAVADNSELAVALGFNVKKLRLCVFALGSALAGLGACLAALDTGMNPDIGMSAVLISAVAVIISGPRVFEAAALGAFLLGFLQNIVVWKISARWEGGVTFLVLVCFLIFRPHGIAGKGRRLEES